MVRRLFRMSAPAIAAMAWRNRGEIAELAGFGLRAVLAAAPGGDGFDDVRTEARLRLEFARDKRLRRADGLQLEVRDGVVSLRGVVSPEVYDLAPAIAEGVEGVRQVDNGMREVGRRRRRKRAALSRER